jgi:hypothetical protein
MKPWTFDATAARLDELDCRPRLSGDDQLYARCPVHDDRKPSLSVGRGEDGRALITCWTCTPTMSRTRWLREFTKALASGVIGEYRPDVQRLGRIRGRRRLSFARTAEYPYAAMDGTALRKLRGTLTDPETGELITSKSFRWEWWTGAGWSPGDGGHRPLLYDPADVIGNLTDGTMLWITEGERDCDALTAQRIPAVSPSHGAGVWRTEWSAQLDPIKRFCVCADDDEPGRTHARKVHAALQRPGREVVIVLAADGCKDAADHFDSGRTRADFRLMDEPLASATTDGLQLIEASTVVAERLHYVWRDRIVLGAMNLAVGEEGIGKSTVISRVAADSTRGTLDGELYGQPRHVVVVAPEDHLAAVAVPRLREAGADLDLITFVAGSVVNGAEGAVIIPRDLDKLTTVVRQRGTALVWVDSLVTTLPEDVRTVGYKDTSTLLRRLGAWAESCGVAVIAPWHLNKAAGTDVALRMMDSRAFRTATRSVLIMAADPTRPGQGLIALDKANAVDRHSVKALRYELLSAPYKVEEVDPTTGHMVMVNTSCGVARWLGEVNGDGQTIVRNLLAPSLEREGDPKQWLRERLGLDGAEVKAEVIKAEAREAGYSDAGIKRAAALLGVNYASRGFPRRTFWWLPKITTADGDSQSAHRDSRSAHSEPTEPTEPTNRSFTQSAQSAQSGQGEPTGQQAEPTGRPRQPDDPMPTLPDGFTW